MGGRLTWWARCRTPRSIHGLSPGTVPPPQIHIVGIVVAVGGEVGGDFGYGVYSHVVGLSVQLGLLFEYIGVRSEA